VRRNSLTAEQARRIFQKARFLEAAEAAGTMLSISQAMAELQAPLDPPCVTR